LADATVNNPIELNGFMGATTFCKGFDLVILESFLFNEEEFVEKKAIVKRARINNTNRNKIPNLIEPPLLLINTRQTH
jgi:hypothetical protein